MEIRLCPADELEEGAMRQFEFGPSQILLVCRAEGKLLATNGICPHRGAQLAAGKLEGTVVTCPWHDWSYDCLDGSGITNPQSSLECYRVWEAEGMIVADLPEAFFPASN